MGSDPADRQAVLQALRDAEDRSLSPGAIEQRTDLTRFRTLQAIQRLEKHGEIYQTGEVHGEIPLYAITSRNLPGGESRGQ